MIEIRYGAFGLDEIKKVNVKDMYDVKIYEISFLNDDRLLVASDLHCFLTEDNKAIRCVDLVKGDRIWMDLINTLS